MVSDYIVLLPCAGSGSRFKSEVPKQYLKINGKTVLEHTIDTFLLVPEINYIMIITALNDNYIDAVLAKYPSRVRVEKIGGQTRTDSVKNGLNKLKCSDNDWVLIHDAARCCISTQAITRIIKNLSNDEVGGILAIPATDTIKLGDGVEINKTLDRNTIYLAQTPQMFRYRILKQALNQVDLNIATDDATLVENLGLKVKLVMGETTNIKVTYKEDISLAKLILDKQCGNIVE